MRGLGLGLYLGGLRRSAAPGGGPEPTPWTPALLPDLYVWYDFSDGATLTLSGPNIDVVGNKASLDRELLPVGGGSVQVSTAAINGRDAAWFQAAAVLRADNVIDVDNTPLSVAFVAQVENNQGGVFQFGAIDESLSARTDSNETVWRICPQSSTGSTMPRAIDAAELVSIVADVGGADAFLDGGVQTCSPGQALGGVIGGDLILGGRSTTIHRMSGYVGEFVACISALSESDRQKLEGYLAHRWGITLDNTHPYFADPPTV